MTTNPALKYDLLLTVGRITHRLLHKGDMMGAELWEVCAPGQLMHGTAVVFRPDQSYASKLAHFTGQHTAATLRASTRLAA